MELSLEDRLSGLASGLNDLFDLCIFYRHFLLGRNNSLVSKSRDLTPGKFLEQR